MDFIGYDKTVHVPHKMRYPQNQLNNFLYCFSANSLLDRINDLDDKVLFIIVDQGNLNLVSMNFLKYFRTSLIYWRHCVKCIKFIFIKDYRCRIYCLWDFAYYFKYLIEGINADLVISNFLLINGSLENNYIILIIDQVISNNKFKININLI